MEEKVIREVETSDSEIITSCESFGRYVKDIVIEDKDNCSMFLVGNDGEKAVCILAGKASNIGKAIMEAIQRDEDLRNLFESISFALTMEKLPAILRRLRDEDNDQLN